MSFLPLLLTNIEIKTEALSRHLQKTVKELVYFMEHPPVLHHDPAGQVMAERQSEA